MLRSEAPCVAYEFETELRFWKAARPTPRRVDMSEVLWGRKEEGGSGGLLDEVDLEIRY